MSKEWDKNNMATMSANVKAARITAGLIFLGRDGRSKDELRAYAEKDYEVPTCDEIRPWYDFDESCQGTMPAVLAAFFDSTDFEDAIRNAISVGGAQRSFPISRGSCRWPPPAPGGASAAPARPPAPQ